MSIGERSSVGLSAVQGAGLGLVVGGIVGSFLLGRAQHRANADTVGVPAVAIRVRPTPSGAAITGVF